MLRCILLTLEPITFHGFHLGPLIGIFYYYWDECYDSIYQELPFIEES